MSLNSLDNLYVKSYPLKAWPAQEWYVDADRRLTIPYQVLLYCLNIVGKALELHVCKLSKEWSQKKQVLMILVQVLGMIM